MFTVHFKINRQNKAQNVKSLGATRQQQRNRYATSIFSCEFFMVVIFLSVKSSDSHGPNLRKAVICGIIDIFYLLFKCISEVSIKADS